MVASLALAGGRNATAGEALVSREHIGLWTGPGILALVDGEWVHYLSRDAPRDLQERATALVGTDRPHITITLAEDVRDEGQP